MLPFHRGAHHAGVNGYFFSKGVRQRVIGNAGLPGRGRRFGGLAHDLHKIVDGHTVRVGHATRAPTGMPSGMSTRMPGGMLGGHVGFVFARQHIHMPADEVRHTFFGNGGRVLLKVAGTFFGKHSLCTPCCAGRTVSGARDGLPGGWVSPYKRKRHPISNKIMNTPVNMENPHPYSRPERQYWS